MAPVIRERLPSWLRRSLPVCATTGTHQVLERYGLHTVCESAACPNQSECFAKGTATFMILGDTCTRNCGFCAVKSGKPEMLDSSEPDRVAKAVQTLGLNYVVITSVTRDDLPDEGAGQYRETLEAIRRLMPDVRVEVLVPDFHARSDLIREVVDAGPQVFNHNLETVRSLQSDIRPEASYSRSLEVLQLAKQYGPSLMTKSGLMLGLGESQDEVYKTAEDLRRVGCDLLTLGQYLPPGPQAVCVKEYVRPEVFRELADEFKAMGFRNVFSGPYVRSSYHAGETFEGLHQI
ncbi:MAG: lipoyl synthase [Candidatus Omnitrophica bacterium]|nr:lipoyl synthase [Candidatus Omnitrophota bacterium]